MSTIVYVSSYQGPVKDGSRDFNKITVVALVDGKSPRVMDLFTEDGRKVKGQDELKFGDVINPEYIVSGYPGEKPQLVGVTKIADSPYFSK